MESTTELNSIITSTQKSLSGITQIEASVSLSLTVVRFLTTYTAASSVCSTTPTSSILSINIFALPSRIGTSGPFSSTRQLSTLEAYNAAMACSIVEIFKSPEAITVPRHVSTTFSATASIGAAPSTSMRRNFRPKLSGAGLNVASISLPVCKPLPFMVKADFNVHCFILSFLFVVFFV